MKNNPVTGSMSGRYIFAGSLMALWIVTALLVMLYTGTGAFTSFAGCFVFACVTAAGGYGYWFAHSILPGTVRRLAAGFAVLLLSAVFALVTFCAVGNTELYRCLTPLPLCLLTGTIFWIILLHWYDSFGGGENAGAGDNTPAEEPGINSEELPASPAETITRITVKDGSNIHIINTGAIKYIQAYGDYVFIYTDKGRFIKEQTMHSLSSSLSGNFVRIHHSVIVNTDHISRVELFGKENYNIRLKSGETLRASRNGYKLLRERLRL